MTPPVTSAIQTQLDVEAAQEDVEEIQTKMADISKMLREAEWQRLSKLAKKYKWDRKKRPWVPSKKHKLRPQWEQWHRIIMERKRRTGPKATQPRKIMSDLEAEEARSP